MDVQYDIEKMTFQQLRNKIALPTFQRSIVWNEAKKKQFIATITNGLPFGVLLLYKEDIAKYSLIDGLQRFSTLCAYEKSPKNYIDFNQECKRFVDDIIQKCVENTGLLSNIKILKNEIIESISDHFSLDKNITTVNIVNDIIKPFSFLKEDMFIYTHLLGMVEYLRKKFSIDDLPIPIIVFNGDFSVLADIFENINTNGSQLSKYDIYAARWSKYILQTKDNEILKAVDEKYVSIQNTTQLEVSGYEQGLVFKTNEINLFEYCFAIGKLIINTAPPLFDIIFNKDKYSIDKNKEKVDSIGFNVIAAILLDTPKKKDDIGRFFQNVNCNQLSDFKNKIIESVITVRDLLLPYLKMPDNNYMVRYIESQITCIIATAFRIKYKVLENTLVIKESNFNSKYRQLLLQKFKQILPLRYLYDILDDYWGNSGDAKIGSALADNLSNNRYVSKITKSEMSDVLDKWMKLQDVKRFKQTQRDSKLFLNYIVQKKNENCDLTNIIDGKLELSSIIPKKRYIDNLNTTSNIAHIGNLTYLPKLESFKTHIIYEVEEPSLYKIKELLVDKFLYPTSDELNFISNKNSFTEVNYNRFLRSRKDFLTNTFLDLFF